MNLIAADIGNSTTKLAIQKGGELRFLNNEHVISNLHEIALPLPNSVACWSLCSVNATHCQLLSEWVRNHRPQDRVHIIEESEVPLKTSVLDRAAVGRDRLVAAWMASQIASPSQPIVVIDAGTAVTIDYVSEARIFQGGVIFPGASSQLRYLGNATDALPDLSQHEAIAVDEVLSTICGRDTRSAILSGVIHSQLYSMISIAEKMSQSNGASCEIFATGGGIERLAQHLPDHWNIVPNLVLQGAMSIGEAIFDLSEPDTR